MTRPSSLLLLIIFPLTALTALAQPNRDTPKPHQNRRHTPVVEVFQKTRDAVVNISTRRIVRMRSPFGSSLEDMFHFGLPRRNRVLHSVGSGVIVHESGYIVTNAHVVSQASDVQVTFENDKTLPAEVVAVDQQHDLAVLKVDSPTPLPHQRLGRSHDIMIGETVVAIGNPLGLQHTVTSGIVSALDRDLHFDRDVVYTGLIQTDAPINPGNSGGPLLNINGDLIGINTAIRGDAQNIGFAIPVDHLWELLPMMLDIERRQRVRFGLQVSGVDAQVVAVKRNTPAAEKGLRAGDHIIEINGEKLRDGIDYYVHLLQQEPDSEVKLVAKRDDRRVEFTVPLRSIPLPDGDALASRLLGADLAEIPPRLRRRYDLPDYARLIVEEVEVGGPAERAGIRAGDLLLRLDRVPVRSLNDVGLALEDTQPRDRVFLEGLRLDANPPFFWSVEIRTRTSN